MIHLISELCNLHDCRVKIKIDYKFFIKSIKCNERLSLKRFY